MFQLVVRIIGLIIVLLGVTCIFDARLLTKRFFGFGDQNEGSNGLKIIGFMIAILGGVILFLIR